MKTPSFIRVGLSGGSLVAGFLMVTSLAGCATVSAVTSTAPSAPASSFGHVHGVGIDERSDTVYIATHEGLFAVPGSIVSPTESASLGDPIAGLHQDNMGFAIDGERMYASGHPDPAVTPDADLGLVSSMDQGKSWSPVSLKGTTDFHDLEISHSDPGATTIYGFDSSNAVIRVSRDGGSTWTQGAALDIRDMAADPALPGTIYATTTDGLKISQDFAASFTISPSAPKLYLIASDGSATQPQLIGIDVAGAVWRKLADAPWTVSGAVTGRADALAFSVRATPMLVVADQRGISASSDFGATWRILVKN